MELASLMFGGVAWGVVDAALLLGLFWAALLHPERSRNIAKSRLSALLVGLAVGAPALFQLILALGTRGGFSGPDELFALGLGPLLSAAAVLLGVGSVTPPAPRT